MIARFAPIRPSMIAALAAALVICGGIAIGSASAQSSPNVTGGPATYVGDETCKGCHQAQAHDFSQTMMGRIMLAHPRDENESRGCESCHGPGSRYVAEMAKAMGQGLKPDHAAHGSGAAGVITFRKDSGESAEQDNAVCMTCHDKGEQSFWNASVHSSRGLKCVDCHTIMRQVSPRFQLATAAESTPFMTTRPETEVCLRCHLKQKMEINLPSHMPVREGAMACTDCHNPHGGPYPDQLVRATVTETCYTCHAEKRGPFLWIHPPVVQNCLNCHQPHGSINRFMLTMRPPRLCQQCHIGTFHPGTPAKANTVFVFSRACMNCHSAIHGSNAPGGIDFTR